MTEHLSQQQRDAYIAASQRNAQEVLQIPEVQYRLGGYASELFTLTKSVVSARVEDGVVHSNDVHPRSIPATVKRVGERIVRMTALDRFDDHQYEAMYRDNDVAEVQDLVARYTQLTEGVAKPLRPFVDELAYTHADSRVVGDNGQVVKGRPMLVSNWDESQLGHVDAPVWFHELKHVDHIRKLSLWNPEHIDFDAQELSWELQGYAISAMIILGIQDAGRQQEFLASTPRSSLDKMREIEEIRKRANRYETDPYAATKEVAEDLVRSGYGITPFLRNKIRNK